MMAVVAIRTWWMMSPCADTATASSSTRWSTTLGFVVLASWLWFASSTSYGIPEPSTWTAFSTSVHDSWSAFRKSSLRPCRCSRVPRRRRGRRLLRGIPRRLGGVPPVVTVESVIPAFTCSSSARSSAPNSQRMLRRSSSAPRRSCICSRIESLDSRTHRAGSRPTSNGEQLVVAGRHRPQRSGGSRRRDRRAPPSDGERRSARRLARREGGGPARGSPSVRSSTSGAGSSIRATSRSSPCEPEARVLATHGPRTFDGTIWKSGGRYGEADGDLGADQPDGLPVESLEQHYRSTISVRCGCPAAFQPVSIILGRQSRYERSSSTLIVDTKYQNSDQIELRRRLEIPTPTEDQLRSVEQNRARQHGAVRAASRRLQLRRPGAMANQVVATAQVSDPYGKALALQDFFRDQGVFANDGDRLGVRVRDPPRRVTTTVRSTRSSRPQRLLRDVRRDLCRHGSVDRVAGARRRRLHLG